jgi:F0F1-type ATP synthase membrane subunit b/b'
MAREKERFEMLLEEIRDRVNIIAEGHDVLRSEIKQVKTELSQEMNNTEDRLTAKIEAGEGRLERKIDHVHASLKNEIKSTFYALDEKITEHIKQPSHA